MMNSLSVELLLAALVLIVIEVLLIMVIWNNVLIKKFPSSNIQKLSFWDALAIGVLTSILFTSPVVLTTN